MKNRLGQYYRQACRDNLNALPVALIILLKQLLIHMENNVILLCNCLGVIRQHTLKGNCIFLLMFITFLLFTLIFISYSTYFQLISWTYGNSLQIDDWVKVKVKV